MFLLGREMWNMTIACALRWEVASIGSFSTERGLPKDKNIGFYGYIGTWIL